MSHIDLVHLNDAYRHVFLTTSIGPGTTIADEVASSTLSPTVDASSIFFPYTITNVTVLSGLSLSAGQYFLSVRQTNGNPGASWVSSPSGSASVTAAPGVTLTDPFLFNGGDKAPYLPATEVGVFAGLSLWTSFEGDPVDPPTVVPEPASGLLVGLGAFVVAVKRGAQKRMSRDDCRFSRRRDLS